MAEFYVTVRKQKIRCWFEVGTLSFRYRNKNYMIEPAEVGWKMEVGKMDDELLQEIGEAIERYLQND